jgi:hypothetical protein
MRALVKSLLCVVVLSLVAVRLSAQQVRSRFDGAWKVVRVDVVSPDSTYQEEPNPGLAVISGRHFSLILVMPNSDGVQQASQPSTIEQKAARYDQLIVRAGTLEVKDTLFIQHVEHAKNPTQVGTTDTRRFRLRGDTLWLVSTEPWSKDPKKSVRTTVVGVRQR